MGWLRVLTTGAVSATLVVPAWSADQSALLERLARQTQREAKSVRLLGADVHTSPFDFTLGLAVARDRGDETARTTYLPMSMQYALDPDKRTTVGLRTDGYTRTSAPSTGSASGWADVELSATRVLASAWLGKFTVVIPTGGFVGSTSATQGLKLKFVPELAAPWSLAASAKGIHAGGQPAGRSPYLYVFYAELGRDLGDGRSLTASATQLRHRGDKTTTDLALEADVPFAERWIGSLSLTRGITPGATHTALELGFTVKF
jgi:hypothetical protein